MKKFFDEFKTFAMKGNFVDLAVGVVVGSAFSSIVNSLVNDIFMPIVALITGDVNFADLKVVLKGDITLNYGAFIQTLVNFLVIAVCMFLVVRFINKAKELNAKEEEKKEEVKEDSPELKELKKIISLLKKK